MKRQTSTQRGRKRLDRARVRSGELQRVTSFMRMYNAASASAKMEKQKTFASFEMF
jgi:hypothetical protein